MADLLKLSLHPNLKISGFFFFFLINKYLSTWVASDGQAATGTSRLLYLWWCLSLFDQSQCSQGFQCGADTCNLPAVIMWENTAGLGPSGANCVSEHCSFSFLPIIGLTCFPAKFTSFSYQFQREKNFKLTILSRFTKPHIKVKHQGIIKLGKLGISHSLNAETLYSQQHFWGEKISES